MNYSLEPTKIFFKATSGKYVINDSPSKHFFNFLCSATTGYVKDYTFSLNLFAEVIPEVRSIHLNHTVFMFVAEIV
jgi:hypothetical protein